MKNNFTTIIKSILSIVLLLCAVVNATAQTSIEKPSFAFTKICANPAFNTFQVAIKFSPVSDFSTTNQFIVEMSDATGSFSGAPTVLYTSTAGAIVASPTNVTFSVPTTTRGENFKLRIKSTSPVLTSPESNAFAAYYKPQDNGFSINNFVATATYCTGGSYMLTIDNPGTGSNDSPLKYPSLSFNWYKETSRTTSDFVAAGPTLTVTTPGTYYVETDYGTCTSYSYSNRVTVTEASVSSTPTITSSLGNPYCPTTGSTVLSSSAGSTYQWSKDGTAIAGATSQTYATNQTGVFSVAVNNGSCSSNASINLAQIDFTSSINVPVSPASNALLTGSTINVKVTTTASNPTYVWYLDKVVISGATSDTYAVKAEGTYKVEITQTTGCVATKQHEFIVTVNDAKVVLRDVANIPNLISPNGDGINDTWEIPLEYVGGTGTEILIFNGQGDVVLQTNNYQNNWPDGKLDFKNVNPVYYYIITTAGNKVKKGSITVVK
ncbi:gliding motility-associated C-terminal domain-containing protein [Flavobacterium muglaense]|uniref:Gliding motility-associated C-terminal domain-containing protein n=1 Tax=Flavobacterium muglaense TaxID=2764716 RepID=A0A923SGA8_9FLAO|nr:gliding motility-associated C-terminal domain-containing protein [Flavobacterium muglaense]MBC5838995.1 gliding motility-associated C-terminal domain-containing protein [Flavobacterium muglaense]MBC5845501.1 gliding motility-associated C-terminal domain-containing protein [Flavobacterium muglaense]